MAECLGITLGRSDVGRFSDGEIQVSIQESVRGRDVYVVQSLSLIQIFSRIGISLPKLRRSSLAIWRPSISGSFQSKRMI